MAEQHVELPTVIETPVAFNPRVSLPQDLDGADYLTRTVYSEMRERLNKRRTPRHLNAQLLGHPPDHENPAEDDQCLLLQVGYHSRTEFAFEDGGDIFFLIAPHAARHGNWSETLAVGISG